MAFPYPRLNGVLASKSSRAFRVITVGLLSCFSSLAAWALSIDQLTTNARTNPLGISGDDVSFGWAVVADERDSTQTAYQIRIGPTEGSSDVWDSGRVSSERQIDIAFPGDRYLKSATRYFWQVRVWDGKGAATE